MGPFLNIVQILLGAFVIALVLLQTKGSSFSGAFGGNNNSIFRSRRGVELLLFQLTIGFGILFMLVSVISALYFKGQV